MRYNLKCLNCGAVCWVRGDDDPDTNSTEYDLDDAVWERGIDDLCEHDEFECVDSEYDDPPEPD